MFVNKTLVETNHWEQRGSQSKGHLSKSRATDSMSDEMISAASPFFMAVHASNNEKDANKEALAIELAIARVSKLSSTGILYEKCAM